MVMFHSDVEVDHGVFELVWTQKNVFIVELHLLPNFENRDYHVQKFAKKNVPGQLHIPTTYHKNPIPVQL